MRWWCAGLLEGRQTPRILYVQPCAAELCPLSDVKLVVCPLLVRFNEPLLLLEFFMEAETSFIDIFTCRTLAMVLLKELWV